MALKEYAVNIGGIEHTMQLDEKDAERMKRSHSATEVKKAKAQQKAAPKVSNKTARKPKDKAPATPPADPPADAGDENPPASGDDTGSDW